jgi:hypothetical protein
MSRGTASALTVVRVARGQPPPAEPELRTALAHDRARLHLPPEKYLRDYSVAGPYPISIDGRELDEYVVWER